MNIENLKIIFDHFYDDEIECLEEELDQLLPNNLDEAIKLCEDNELTNFIGYNLLILKRDLENS